MRLISLYLHYWPMNRSDIVLVLSVFRIHCMCTRGVQYVMKTAQYIPKFYIYAPRNYFNLKVCFMVKYM